MNPATALLLVALAPAAPAPGPAAPAGPPTATPALPGPAVDAWLPRPGVQLTVLDKVSARSTLLSGKVGQELRFGPLTVVAQACVVRGPDVPADAAAFLNVTDAQQVTPPFHAWMLLSEPAQSIYQHPVYDIRLTGCGAAP